MPRFVRVNDTFEAGVIVTVPAAPATVTITASLLPPNGSAAAPLKAPGQLTKALSFTVQGGLQQEARFQFAAVAVGTAGVLFAAEATEGEGDSATTVSDSLQLEIPVHGERNQLVKLVNRVLFGLDSDTWRLAVMNCRAWAQWLAVGW